MALTEEDTTFRRMMKCMLMAGLRQAYPKLPREALAEIVVECGDIMKAKILEAKKALPSFWSLPAGIRNRIYKLAMEPDKDNNLDQKQYSWVDGKPVIVLQSQYADKYGWDPDLEGTWWLQPAITKVNRQMRAEALPIYYGTTEFAVFGSGFSEQFSMDVNRRIMHFGEHQKLIRHFSVLYQDMLQHDGEETEEQLKTRTIDCFADDQFGLEYEVPRIPRPSIKVKVLQTVEKTVKVAPVGSGKGAIAPRRRTKKVQVDDYVEI